MIDPGFYPVIKTVQIIDKIHVHPGCKAGIAGDPPVQTLPAYLYVSINAREIQAPVLERNKHQLQAICRPESPVSHLYPVYRHPGIAA